MLWPALLLPNLPITGPQMIIFLLISLPYLFLPTFFPFLLLDGLLHGSALTAFRSSCPFSSADSSHHPTYHTVDQQSVNCLTAPNVSSMDVGLLPAFSLLVSRTVHVHSRHSLTICGMKGGASWFVIPFACVIVCLMALISLNYKLHEVWSQVLVHEEIVKA